MTTTTLTKQQKIDAAVAAVEANAQQALDGDYLASEYVEADGVAAILERDYVLVREQVPASRFTEVDRARLRVIAQAKRLLDEEAARPEPRILRFSSRDHALLPRLDGTRRPLYGNAVGYTTPELYKRAQAAVEDANTLRRAEEQTMDELLRRAEAAGLPTPVGNTRHAVTYSVDGLHALVERAERRHG